MWMVLDSRVFLMCVFVCVSRRKNSTIQELKNEEVKVTVWFLSFNNFWSTNVRLILINQVLGRSACKVERCKYVLKLVLKDQNYQNALGSNTPINTPGDRSQAETNSSLVTKCIILQLNSPLKYVSENIWGNKYAIQ